MKKMEMFEGALMYIGLVAVIYLAYVGIHELGHYVVDKQNNVNVRQVCLMGWLEDGNGTMMSGAAWVISDWYNNTEVDDWHDNWDYAWYGWVYDVFGMKEEIG